MKQTRRRRILIVDDSKMNREILTGIFEDEYDIVEAEDGKKAIAIMEEGLYSFSIVLLDITMPELDGFGVLQVMQQRNWLKELPVIIISAETSNEYIGHAYEMGVSDYFSRPFDARIVNTRVRNTIALFERDYIDQVTGGGNRKEFIRRVSRSLKEMTAKTDYVLLFFNIKNFKAVNELLGVGGGDKLLCWFYQRIIYSRFAPIDTSRIESDHFACLIEARNLDYDYLTEFCNFNYGKEKRKMHIYSTCGIYYIQENDVSVTGMIDRAKLAKGYITDEYLKPYAIFKSDMKDTYVDEMEICSEFEEGIEKQEFQVFYQPVVDAKTGKIVSAEALVRWFHEQKGFISPGQFIPALEKGGYISELDRYMIEKVTGCLDQRRAEKKRFVPVSVNLSWMDFYDENMLEWIVRGLKKNNQNEQKIRFEITETSLAAIGENHTRMLMHLKENGAEILLDDFGSGYSSEGTLLNMEVNIVKLDMGLVSGIDKNRDKQELAANLIHYCKERNILVLAEGVERIEEVHTMLLLGADLFQGYYFGRPELEIRPVNPYVIEKMRKLLQK